LKILSVNPKKEGERRRYSLEVPSDEVLLPRCYIGGEEEIYPGESSPCARKTAKKGIESQHIEVLRLASS